MTTIPTNVPPKPVLDSLWEGENDGIIRQEMCKRGWATLLYWGEHYYVYGGAQWVYRSPVVAPNMDLRKWEQALMRSLVEFEDYIAISFQVDRQDGDHRLPCLPGYCERKRIIETLLKNQHKPGWHSVAALQKKYAADTLEGRIISDWLEKDQPTYRYATPIQIRGDA